MTRLCLPAMALAIGAGVVSVKVALRVPPEDGLLFLLAVPVGALALRHGERVAVIAVLSASMIVVCSAVIQDDNLSVVGYATRLLIFAWAGYVGVFVRRSPVGGRARAAGSAPGPTAPRDHDLTKRELEVLRLLASGHTNKEAAFELGLSVRTIESHRARIQDKLACGGRSDLFRRAHELGILAA